MGASVRVTPVVPASAAGAPEARRRNRPMGWAAGLAVAAGFALSGRFTERWAWVSGWSLDDPASAAGIEDVVRTAGKVGLNGVVVSAGLDRLSSKGADALDRLDRIRAAADRAGVELIPAGFSVGYGTAFLARNPMLAEGLPVVDAPFVVRRGEARLETSAAALLSNGGFEENDGIRAAGFAAASGAAVTVDLAVRRGGTASLRLGPAAAPGSPARTSQEIRVARGRCYRLRFWAKTRDLSPAVISVRVTGAGRDLAPRQFEVERSSDWRRLALLFNSLGADRARVTVGIADGSSGTLWLDDVAVEEVGPIDVLRRPGTPVTVASEDGRTIYEEGKDYRPLSDPGFDLEDVDRSAPPLRVEAGGRIRDGARLRVGWYHPVVIGESQVPVCLGEPEVDAIVEREARIIGERLRPRSFFLLTDEIRMAGTCRACGGRPAAELVGGAIGRLAGAVRRAIPGVRVFAWSDMLDPERNARDGYYLVSGGLADAWRSAPRDVEMVVWGREASPRSLDFFSSRGFRVLVAGYYDAGDLAGVRGWIREALPRPAVTGLMYTTWHRDYGLLREFGRLLAPPSPGRPVRRVPLRRP